MKKTAFLLLVFLSFLALVIRFVTPPLSHLLGYKEKAGIKITSIPQAMVFINGKEVGQTPYQDENLKVEEYRVELKAGDAQWQSKVKLTNGTMAVVNREISASAASSSGEILTLDKGSGVVITSTPSSSDVEIDGKEAGKTPLSVSSLPPGEHTFLLSRDGYLKRNIRASLPDGLALIMDVNLAISEIDLGDLPTPKVAAVVKMTVKQTSTGFLRLRDQPSTRGKEIGRLSSGDTVTLVEELSGWYKVKTDKEVEGYVSSSYVEKQ